MLLIEIFLSALDLLLPSGDERTRRQEQIGCLVGLVAGVSLGLIFVAAYLLGNL